MKSYRIDLSKGVLLAVLLLGLAGFARAEEEENEGATKTSGALLGDIQEESHASTYYQVSALRKLALPAAGPWETQGPTGIGRINEVVVDPANDQVVYTGAATGGVWKSTDGGTTQNLIFNNNCTKNGSPWPCDQSIGAIAVDPNSSQTVWVGGGEDMYGGGSHTYPGTGIYKSTNGGTTWQHMGLDSSFYIPRIAVTPGNSNRVFAAVQGAVWGKNKDRGIYRTNDGGTTWEMVLGPGKGGISAGDDSTGAVEVRVHPTTPNRIFAHFFTAHRMPYARTWGGPASRVYRSDDGGTTWAVIGAAEGLPTTDLGKSTMDICASSPNNVYMVYFTGSNTLKNIYKSTDGGMTWATVTSLNANSSNLYSYYAHTFGQIRVNPSDANDVVVLGISSYRSTNGGTSWSTCFTGAHADHRTMAWSRTNGQLVYLGDDGGLKKSTAGPNGTLTNVSAGMTIAQLYALDIAPGDNANYRYFGLQDNGCLFTTTGLTGASGGFTSYVGGDGMQIRVDHGNPNYVIGGSQYGAFQLSTNRGAARGGLSGYTGRKLWDAGVALDSASGFTYVGSQFVHRATRGSASYTQISNDLTNGDHSEANYPMGTISCISAHNNVLFAGTDDGNVWVHQTANTATAATGWTRIRNGNGTGPEPAGDRRFDGWIKLITPDYSVANGSSALISISYFRWGIRYWKPSIYRVVNYGLAAGDWQDIHGDLPPRVSTNRVVKDGAGNLYVGTDYGVFISANNGLNWFPLGTGLPVVPVNDLVIHAQTNYLYIGTFGRGIWRYSLAGVTSIPKEKWEALASKGGQVLKNFPNPVTSSTRVQFKVNDAQDLFVAIYDLSGRQVRGLSNGKVKADETYTLTWDRKDSKGARVEKGTYILRAIGDKVTLARKLNVE